MIWVAAKDEDGRVRIQPPNITTKKLKRGKNDDVLFKKPSYVTTGGDLYKSNSAMLLRKFDASASKVAHEGGAFRPLVAIKEKLYKASYEHLSEHLATKKNFRDEDGRVKLAPPQINTTGLKIGKIGKGCTFGGTPSHRPDLYEEWRLKQRAQREENQSKLQEAPFKSRVPSLDTICKNSAVYAEDVKLLPKPPAVKKPPQVVHDQPFTTNKPPRSGYNCTLSQYPKHVPCPPKPKSRPLAADPNSDAPPPPFKMTHKCNKSRPSTSIVLNTKNLKHAFPSIFKK